MAGSFLLFLASLVSCLFLFPVAVSEDALTELPSAAEGIISGAADPLTEPESSATAPAESEESSSLRNTKKAAPSQ